MSRSLFLIWWEVTDLFTKACATMALINFIVAILVSIQDTFDLSRIFQAFVVLALFMACTYYQGLYSRLKAAANEAD